MIRHAHVSEVVNDPTKDVSSDRWNEAHEIEDGSILVEHLDPDVQEVLAAAIIEGDPRLTDARTPLTHDHTFTPDRVIIADTTTGVVTTDGALVWNNATKRLGIGGAPTVALDVFLPGNAAVLTPGVRLTNETPATALVPRQYAPALVFSGRAWDTNGAVSVNPRLALYHKVIDADNPSSNLTLALDDGNGTFADHISFGVAQAGGSADMRFREGSVALKNDGRGLVWTGTPLTDALASAATRIVGNSGGHIDVQPGAQYLLITANTLGDTTIPAGLDIRAVDFSSSAVPIMATRFKAHPTFGTAAAGFGGRMLFQSGSTTTNYRDAATIDWVWNDAADASRSADLVFRLVHGAAAHAEMFRMRSNGQFDAATLAITDGVTAPAATSGQAKIYVDTADGDLKIVFGDGTVKTIVTD